MKLPLPLQKLVKPGKTWIVLGVALAVGIFAAIAVRAYIVGRVEALEAQTRGHTVNVVVAKQDLPKGERLTPENVAVRPIPVDFAHTNAVVPESFDRIEGEALDHPVKGGEMILWSLLESRKAPSFSARVAAGRRAITVPVDEINSISGMLEPGDVVDLLATIEQNGRSTTFALLQDVQVLATGQHADDVANGGERRQFTTVTLDTTPEEAQQVVVAREAGKLTALLRNPQDHARLEALRGDLAALLGQAARGSDAQVPVLYGGQSGRIPAEGLRLGHYVAEGERPANAAAPASMPSLAGNTVPSAPRF